MDRPCANVMVLLLWGLSPWGEPGGGGEIPMNVRFFSNIFPMKIMIISCYSELEPFIDKMMQ
jgi:hypothetical protein